MPTVSARRQFWESRECVFFALWAIKIFRFHMNEGHSALLTLALLEEEIGRQNLTKISVVDLERVREKCVFTTHTPVPAAFDQFSLELTTRILGANRVRILVEHSMRFAGMLMETPNSTMLKSHLFTKN